jgi:hypothetical protein
MLDEKYKQILKDAARSPRLPSGEDNPEFGKYNEELEIATEIVMIESPYDFLTKWDLASRVFYNEPMSNIPYASFVRPYTRLAKNVKV